MKIIKTSVDAHRQQTEYLVQILTMVDLCMWNRYFLG